MIPWSLQGKGPQEEGHQHSLYMRAYTQSVSNSQDHHLSSSL